MTDPNPLVVSCHQGWHIKITDVTTGHSGTVVLNSKYGPMLPAFSAQKIGNALGWGIADDTPNSLSGRSATPHRSHPASTPGLRSTTPHAAFTFGVDYPGTSFDYGKASQFATTQQCGGPFGPNSTYCDTILSPIP